MNRIKTLTQKIQRAWRTKAWRTKAWRKKTPDQNQPDIMRTLLHMLKNTREVEYSCEEVYDLLDQYAEMVARGEDAAQLMPLINHHLELCKDCNDEYEALMRILETVPA